ncbi:MAG TPA: hypothetical protein VMF65_18020, partial [Acidimicrobiales bacterium]|nr:hypothetical protein [Acidimicrobiales bacterium]
MRTTVVGNEGSYYRRGLAMRGSGTGMSLARRPLPEMTIYRECELATPSLRQSGYSDDDVF